MGRIAGCHGEMGDHGMDAHCNNSSLHHSSRSNLHPEDHPKMKGMGLATTRAGCRRNSKMLAVSSGLVGQPTGDRLPWDQESSSGKPLQGPSARPKDEGVPAGCVSGRIAGRHGEQGASSGLPGDRTGATYFGHQVAEFSDAVRRPTAARL